VNEDRHTIITSCQQQLLLIVCVCPCCWVCRCQRCAGRT